jgi:hypothetical protein
MKNNIVQYTLLTAFAMIAVAMFRLFPNHPLNFAPVAAIALYGGARGKNVGFSFALPILVMLISDLLVMQVLYPERGNPLAYFFTKDAFSVYLAFSLIVCVGLLLKRNIKVPTVILASLGSSFLFYVVTNFITWYGAPFYPQNFAGLIECYAAGIPFYKGDITQSFFLNQFIGDLFFNGVLFGAHALVARTANNTVQA